MNLSRTSHTRKLVNNTIASYIRIICNAVLAIFATRFALQALGASDFGLYNLIAGIVAMLSFVNGALMISSQRYFSIAIGNNHVAMLRKYFYSSLVVHIILGLIIGLLLIAIEPLLFNHVFNIASDAVPLGKIIYRVTVISSIITVMTIPYSAIMNAKEDMVAMAAIDIVAILIRFAAAAILLYISSYLLETYTILCFLSIVVKWWLEMAWSHKKYPYIFGKLKEHFDKNTALEMSGFVGWNTLGSFAVLARNQGVAIVLNMFFGTVINAAYGIANQVNGMVLSFATTLTTVFTPSIIQAKGAGDEKRMISLAIMTSKLSFLLSSLMALPILVFLKPILSIWLTDIPENTEIFCVYIILCFLITQLYPGINRALYADGRIKWYQITVSACMILILPTGYILFSEGYAASAIMLAMLFFQIIVMALTVIFAHIYLRINLTHVLFRGIVLPCLVFLSFILSALFLFDKSNWSIADIIVYSTLIDSAFIIAYVFLIFSKEEKEILLSRIKRN